jgi:hypothetical protein
MAGMFLEYPSAGALYEVAERGMFDDRVMMMYPSEIGEEL